MQVCLLAYLESLITDNFEKTETMIIFINQHVTSDWRVRSTEDHCMKSRFVFVTKDFFDLANILVKRQNALKDKKES